MQVQIKSRFSGTVLFEAEIGTEFESHPYGFRLGLAVKAASKVGANLRGAYLSNANLSGAYLRGAYLSNADLSGAVLSDAVLSDADLSGAVLRGADLRGAYLSNADLSGAVLRDADLSGAVLRGADLRGAVLSDAKVIRLVARLTRINDPYEFFAFETDKGLIIRAGCRTMSLADYRAHIERQYPGTDKAEETTAILDFIEARAAVFAKADAA